MDVLTRIYAPIETVMADVRALVSGLWRDALALVSTGDAAILSQQAEGKLLRPALCLLATGALGAKDLHAHVRLAAAYETMHLASLTHDDVVDHASVRRGQNALNIQWSNHAAILGGDYLVARALELLLEYQSMPLTASALQAMRRMAEGELRFYGQQADTADERTCIALADSKTASLFAAACSAPAHLIAPDKAQALYDFGKGLGIAFQLVDDLLDVTQLQSTLGKPACGDVAEGKHTLPLYLLRQQLDDDGCQRLSALKGAPVADPDVRWIAETVRQTGVMEVVLDRADAYVRQGLDALLLLPESCHRESMERLARFILTRQA